MQIPERLTLNSLFLSPSLSLPLSLFLSPFLSFSLPLSLSLARVLSLSLSTLNLIHFLLALHHVWKLDKQVFAIWMDLLYIHIYKPIYISLYIYI